MSVALLLIVCALAFACASRRPRHWHGHGRRLHPDRDGELARLRDAVDDLSARFHRLETERDFYRELLGAPSGGTAAPGEERRDSGA